MQYTSGATPWAPGLYGAETGAQAMLGAGGDGPGFAIVRYSIPAADFREL